MCVCVCPQIGFVRVYSLDRHVSPVGECVSPVIIGVRLPCVKVRPYFGDTLIYLCKNLSSGPWRWRLAGPAEFTACAPWLVPALAF